jgi:hypothetical protein
MLNFRIILIDACSPREIKEHFGEDELGHKRSVELHRE